MEFVQYLNQFMNEYGWKFEEISDEIWAFAETRFQEKYSSALQANMMRDWGFRVQMGLAGEETAFLAEYGEGKPVIAMLGEYDALEGMSQRADVPFHDPLVMDGPGHGCGHNLLGVGAMAAAIALKEYARENNIPGTIRYYGCPAEENAGGKAFLVREGLFDDCDVALYWHPFAYNRVEYGSSNANYRVFFTFHGTSSHAASAPHLGRSALDAVELMDVGVNYMREHMIDEARVHYAITDPGGNAPNVVQSRAQVLYAIRAPKAGQVDALYERICKIAKGAAMMTETEVEIRQVAAYSNMIANTVVSDELERAMLEVAPIGYSPEELAYAAAFTESLPPQTKETLREKLIHLYGPEQGAIEAEKPINSGYAAISKYEGMKGSADLGDVSWVVPAGYFYGTTWSTGTPPHTWQACAQGKSSIAHKGMLRAAKILALTGLRFLESPELVAAAWENHRIMLNGESYPNPLKPECKPEVW